MQKDRLSRQIKAVVKKLLPCPFCGRQPDLQVCLGGLFNIRCVNEMHCICPSTAYYGRLPAAVKAWNSRPR